MKALSVLLLLAVVAVSSVAASAVNHAETLELWEGFKKKFNRKYTPQDEPSRLVCFIENVAKLPELRERNPLATFGINEFSDICLSEFSRTHGGFRPRQPLNTSNLINLATYPRRDRDSHVGLPPPPAEPGPPNQWDWRALGKVRPVRTQGANCAADFAFSAIGNMESQWAIENNINVTLSAQELVDCTHNSPYNNDGCYGGDMGSSFSYVRDNGGIATEAQYPYVGYDQYYCTPIASKMVKVVYWGYFPNTEAEFLKGTWKRGPVSVAVSGANDSAWQSYTGGILQACDKREVDLGVLIVGYDIAHSSPYWIIRNSWGTGWGESGYIRLRYGNNTCGVINYGGTQVVAAKYPPVPSAPPSP